MRNFSIFAGVLLLVTVAAAGQLGCPRTATLGEAPKAEMWMRGVIDHRQVRAYVQRGGNVAVGVFYSIGSAWKPTLVSGEWTGSLLQMSTDPDDTTTDEHGTLKGTIEQSGFEGRWTVPEGGSVPVRLTPETAPSCSSNGSVKRFSDPDWPVTFLYPASWQISRDGSGRDTRLQVTCPNPATMLYASELTLEQGYITDKDDVEKLKDWGYRLADGRWTHRFLSGGDVDAIAKRSHGISVVNGDGQEWRIYCRSGGYVGQGDGSERLLILGDRWVLIRGEQDYSAVVPRIVDSARPLHALKSSD